MNQETRSFIEEILRTSNDLTFATVRPDGYPQANTVSYASDGLTLYFGTGRESQKVKNLRFTNKVSATVDLPYSDWSEIRSLSLGGVAEIIGASDAGAGRAGRVLIEKFPKVRELLPLMDRASMVFVKIVPEVFSVLDYRQSFGHTELVRVDGGDVAA